MRQHFPRFSSALAHGHHNMSVDEIILAVKKFRSEPKFRCSEPEFSMLSPSPDSVTLQAKNEINSCAEELVAAIGSKASDGEIRNTINKHLWNVEKTDLDTEDREYVAFYFHKLGKLVEVNVSFNVNRWLYGFPIAIFSKIFKAHPTF